MGPPTQNRKKKTSWCADIGRDLLFIDLTMRKLELSFIFRFDGGKTEGDLRYSVKALDLKGKQD